MMPHYQTTSYSEGLNMRRASANCPCAGASLDKLIQPAILATLSVEPLHGYRIVGSLARMRLLRGRRPDVTGVYRALKSMSERGLVVGTWGEPLDGPARQRFELTAAGRRCVARWLATLAEYRRGLDELAASLRQAASRSPKRRRGGKRAAGIARVRECCG
jgi:DNA-binding PadR family transcriptional regulator